MVSDDDANRNQTPPKNSTSPRSTRQWPDDNNPFVAFRRYADEQISSMLQSVMGLPSMATPPVPNRWGIFADDSYDNARAKRPGENSNSEDGALSRQDDSLDAYRYCNRWWNGFVGFSDFWRSDFDDIFPFGSRFMLPFFSTFDEGFDDTASWPGAYLLFSPYSPLNLEGSSLGGQREGNVFSSLVSSLRSDGNGGTVENAEFRWHEAFEDLVRLENGKPMLERQSGVDAVSRKETGMDWLKGMIQRGSLGDGWKWQQADDNPNNGYVMLERGQFPRPSERAAETENVKKDGMGLTEQDLYDHFLEGLERREREFSKIFDESRTLRFLLEEPRRKEELLYRQRRLPEEADNRTLNTVTGETNNAPAPEFSQSLSTEQAKTEPHVVSTHTNTRRNRMADGSIHTKIVKTQRFSDGHEETNESVDVANSPEKRSTTDHEQSSNEGWFWR